MDAGCATAYREWPLFAALLDNAEMSLAKTDRRLAERYLALGGRPDLAERVLDELDRTRREVLRLLDQDALLERKPHLHRQSAARPVRRRALPPAAARAAALRAHGEEAAARLAPAAAADRQRGRGGAAEHRLSGVQAGRPRGQA